MGARLSGCIVSEQLVDAHLLFDKLEYTSLQKIRADSIGLVGTKLTSTSGNSFGLLQLDSSQLQLGASVDHLIELLAD